MELKVTDFYDYFKVLSKNSRKHLRKSCYMLLVFFFFLFLQKMKASVDGMISQYLLYCTFLAYL